MRIPVYSHQEGLARDLALARMLARRPAAAIVQECGVWAVAGACAELGVYVPLVPTTTVGLFGIDLGPVDDVIDAAGSAVKTVANVAAKVIDPVLKVAAPVLSPLKDAVSKVESIAEWPIKQVQAAVSLIPGIGSGISAAIEAGLTILKGGSPLDVAIHAAYGALPIPPGIRTITDAVLDGVLTLAHQGPNLTDIALSAARDAVPSGFPRDVFDTLSHLVVAQFPHVAHQAAIGRAGASAHDALTLALASAAAGAHPPAPVTPPRIVTLRTGPATVTPRVVTLKQGPAAPPGINPVDFAALGRAGLNPSDSPAVGLEALRLMADASFMGPPTPARLDVRAQGAVQRARATKGPGAPAAAPPPAVPVPHAAAHVSAPGVTMTPPLAPGSPGAPPGASHWTCTPAPDGSWACRWI